MVHAMNVKEDKGDKFGNYQCPKNNYEIDQMMSMPYALTIESIMYDQTCTCPDLAFTTGMFGRYQTHKAVQTLRYLLGTKSLRLTCI